MKNTHLIIAALMLSLGSQAQIGKGRMMLSGSINYSNNHSSRTDTAMYAQQPINDSKSYTGTISYGYFITNRIMVGVYGSYSNQNNNNKSTFFNGSNYINSTDNNTSHTLTGGVFSRYYQMLGKSRFALFGQLSAGYAGGKEEYKSTTEIVGISSTTTNSHGDISSINVGFNPGLVFFVTKNIAIETSFGNIGFTSQRIKNYGASGNYNETKNTSFNTNFGFSLSSLTWGVNFYFGGKKDKSEIPVKQN